MKKSISILFITSFVLSAVTMQIGTIDATNNTVEIMIDSAEEIRGFQFDIEGIDLTSGSGGLAEQHNFDIYASGNTALGFSIDGNMIPAGTGVLTILQGTISDNLCLPFTQGVGPEDDTPIIVNQSGEALSEILIAVDSGCEPMSIEGEYLTFNLFETYPNPFNPSLNINVSLIENGNVNIQVYNINGQLIHNVYNGILAANQESHFIWDASNFSSGIYIIKIKTDNFSQSRIVNLLK